MLLVCWFARPAHQQHQQPAKKKYNFLIYQEHKYGFHNNPTNKNVFNVTSLMMNNINAVSTNINLLLLLFWLFIL